MARLVAAFGSSHSIMLVSQREDWMHGFRQIDTKNPFYFDKHTRRWYLDVATYPSMDQVRAKPAGWTITPALILAADNHRRGLPY